MQLSLPQLFHHLKQEQSLASIYLLYGEEFLLRQEARDAIRQAAKQKGYTYYQRFEITPHFDWQQISYEYNSFNLFNEYSMIEINNLLGKYEAAASKALISYSKNPAHDKILLIMSTLTNAQQKSDWFSAIKQHGIVVQIPTIRPHELPNWITQRLQQTGLTATKESVQLLAELTEGNLLACQQAIEKLKLLFPQEHVNTSRSEQKNSNITPQHIAAVASNNARFNIFSLSDDILRGHTRRILLIMNNLQAEDAEPALVLWALTKELRLLIGMLTALAQGQSMQQAVAKQWQQRQPLYKTALTRLTLSDAKRLLQFAQGIDLTLKGFAPGNVWQQLLRLSLAIAGKDPLPHVNHSLDEIT